MNVMVITEILTCRRPRSRRIVVTFDGKFAHFDNSIRDHLEFDQLWGLRNSLYAHIPTRLNKRLKKLQEWAKGHGWPGVGGGRGCIGPRSHLRPVSWAVCHAFADGWMDMHCLINLESLNFFSLPACQQTDLLTNGPWQRERVHLWATKGSNLVIKICRN